MGQEFRGKGGQSAIAAPPLLHVTCSPRLSFLVSVNIALGPMSNMGRVAEGGRNWEGFGEE